MTTSSLFRDNEVSREYKKIEDTSNRYNLERVLILKHEHGFCYESVTIVTENDRQAFVLKQKLEKQGLKGKLLNDYLKELEKRIVFRDTGGNKFEDLTVKINSLCIEKGVSIKKFDKFVAQCVEAILDHHYNRSIDRKTERQSNSPTLKQLFGAVDVVINKAEQQSNSPTLKQMFCEINASINKG